MLFSAPKVLFFFFFLQNGCFFKVFFLPKSTTIPVNRAPTRTSKKGEHFPVGEKSGHFTQNTGKTDEFN